MVPSRAAKLLVTVCHDDLPPDLVDEDLVLADYIYRMTQCGGTVVVVPWRYCLVQWSQSGVTPDL